MSITAGELGWKVQLAGHLMPLLEPDFHGDLSQPGDSWRPLIP